MRRRVLYLDLDGTVRKGFDELGRFVNGPDDVELFDGVAERIWRYRDGGYRVIAVSNQGGIALGHMTLETCAAAMQKTQRLTRNGFDKIMFCRHHPQATDPEHAVCWCRKPRIGGLVETALSLAAITAEFYPPHLALFVGDRPEDEQCAANAGIPFMWAKDWRDHGEPLLRVGP